MGCGSRVHDEGAGPPVVFFHGEPTWSYLWREVIPPVRDAGHRCIAPDLPGFGRSDKPLDLGWYTYDRHVAVMAGLLERLGLRGAHCGGPRLGRADRAPARGRASRVVRPPRDHRHRVVHRPPGDERCMAGVPRLRRADGGPAGRDAGRGATARGLGDADAAAYDAPFPTPASKAGARAFPLMLPTAPGRPGRRGRATRPRRAPRRRRPALCLWADGDPILRSTPAAASPPPAGSPTPRWSATRRTSSRRTPGSRSAGGSRPGSPDDGRRQSRVVSASMATVTARISGTSSPAATSTP